MELWTLKRNYGDRRKLTGVYQEKEEGLVLPDMLIVDHEQDRNNVIADRSIANLFETEDLCTQDRKRPEQKQK